MTNVEKDVQILCEKFSELLKVNTTKGSHHKKLSINPKTIEACFLQLN